MTAAQLRALVTADGLWALSEIVLVGPDGKRLTVARRQIHKPAEVDEATGRKKPSGVPTLVLFLEPEGTG